MKRILVYVMIFLQVAVVIILGWQYTLIDKYGESIDLLIDNQYQTFDYTDYQGNVYVDYEIQGIDRKKWPKEIEKTYHEKFYVLLEANEEDIYEIEEVSKHKIQAKEEQIVFIGKYDYEDTVSGKIFVTYGIEKINEPDLYREINKHKQAIVTIKVAPWGQKKIVDVRNIEK